jgi:hypothetical protein
MLLELVLQMAQAQGLYDTNSSTVSPAEAALQLLCRLYGGAMSLSDMRQARLHELVRLPLLAPSGAAAKKVSLVHCSIMRLLAARVAAWTQQGPPPTLAVLKSFGQALALQLEVGLLTGPVPVTASVCASAAAAVIAAASAAVAVAVAITIQLVLPPINCCQPALSCCHIPQTMHVLQPH